MNKCSIIVVTYNSSAYIDKCVDSIQNDIGSLKGFKIILIDNNSIDSTQEKVKLLIQKYKNIKNLCNTSNLGFAKAVNQGLRLVDSQWYLLINPDSHLEPGSISRLIRYATSKGFDICGGRTISLDGITQGDHFKEPTLKVGIFDFTNIRKFSSDDKWHKYFYMENSSSSGEVDAVTGGFMLISRKTIKTIGLFDESFFMYLEDIDFCVRARRSGLKVGYFKDSLLHHFGGGSSASRTRTNTNAWYNSRKRYFLKHFGKKENALIQPLFFVDKKINQISEIIHETLNR